MTGYMASWGRVGGAALTSQWRRRRPDILWQILKRSIGNERAADFGGGESAAIGRGAAMWLTILPANRGVACRQDCRVSIPFFSIDFILEGFQ